MSECTRCEESLRDYKKRLEQIERIHDYHDRKMAESARWLITLSVIGGFIIGYATGVIS